jgi:hypothetical protein
LRERNEEMSQLLRHHARIADSNPSPRVAAQAH